VKAEAMTDCPDCAAANDRQYEGGRYTAQCMVCEARRIASRPVCADARARGVITDAYKAELCAVAGEVHWQAVHDLVRAWQRGERVRR
jgi:hypothetical protein